MSTSFTGLRQSKYLTPYVKSATVFLDIDFNEDLNEDKIDFTNIDSSDPIYSVGLTDTLTAEQDFDQATLTLDSFVSMGVEIANTNINLVDSDISNFKRF